MKVVVLIFADGQKLHWVLVCVVYVVDQVPELAGFWLLTLLVQSPFVFFLLFNEAAIITPLERAVTVVMATFVLFESIAGYAAIRAMVKSQMNKFHLQQFKNVKHMDELPDNDLAGSDVHRRHPHAA